MKNYNQFIVDSISKYLDGVNMSFYYCETWKTIFDILFFQEIGDKLKCHYLSRQFFENLSYHL